MIDLNDEEQQQERKYGPVPAGSRVLVRMEIQQPKYPAPFDNMIARTKNGMFQLFCKFTVLSPTYAGCFWYENITLPAASQEVSLDEKQQTSARIGGSLLRAIIEADRRIDPKATDSAAVNARRINSWRDMNGMAFPAKLGIDKRPYVGANGNEYWNNRILAVVPVTSPEYRQLMKGGEFIANGPVTGEPAKAAPVQNAANAPAQPAYEHDVVPF